MKKFNEQGLVTIQFGFDTLKIVKVKSKKDVLTKAKMLLSQRKSNLNRNIFIQNDFIDLGKDFKSIVDDPRWDNKEWQKHHNFHMVI